MYRNEIVREAVDSRSAVAAFLTGVYYWMTFALGLSALCAWAVGTTPKLSKMVFGSPLLWILIIAELGLVCVLSGMIQKMSASLATALFAAYAALNGVTLGFVFAVYSPAAITSAFATTAVTFGAMAVFGTVTKRDLTKLGSLLFMALIGLVIASVVNIFWANSTLYWGVTYAGVLIFVGLTAYDAQKIKLMYYQLGGTSEMNRKLMVLGALSLYLDFVNLFLYLLRIFGKRN